MDREGGFIVLHRKIKAWPLWKFMSADQRMVWVQILLDANWKDSEAWHGTRRFTVKRGQLIHSERTIAREAGVSRKVVRTTIEKLLIEGAITREPVSNIGQVQIDGGHETGPVPGPIPHLITVVNYSKYQDVPDGAGPILGPSEAQDGPKTGPRRAPSEQGEQEEQEKKGASLTLVAPPPKKKGREPKSDALPPFRRRLSDALVAVYAEVRGTKYGFDAAKDGQALGRLLTFSDDVEDHARRFRAALTAPSEGYSYRVDTVAQFATGRIWNHYPPTATPGPVKIYPPNPVFR